MARRTLDLCGLRVTGQPCRHLARRDTPPVQDAVAVCRCWMFRSRDGPADWWCAPQESKGASAASWARCRGRWRPRVFTATTQGAVNQPILCSRVTFTVISPVTAPFWTTTSLCAPYLPPKSDVSSVNSFRKVPLPAHGCGLDLGPGRRVEDESLAARARS